MPDIQKYKSIALNHDSYQKLAAMAETNNRAKGRELAGMIDKRYEEVVKQKQFIQEITNELKKVNSEAEQKIQKEMDDIPSVLDSKPQVLKEGD